MKGVVVYDTYYGNTKKVAEAIVEQIKADGHEAELRSVREKFPSPPNGDFLFVGSPNRMSKVSGKTKRFVKKLDVDSWKSKPIAVFVTVGQMPAETADEKEKARAQKWILEAGPKLRDFAKARGLNVVDKVLHVPVKDSKGPLVDNGIELTKQYTHEFVATLKK
jgi:menaquinone-dependent protoporphyrinogen IX oxidase